MQIQNKPISRDENSESFSEQRKTFGHWGGGGGGGSTLPQWSIVALKIDAKSALQCPFELGGGGGLSCLKNRRAYVLTVLLSYRLHTVILENELFMIVLFNM